MTLSCLEFRQLVGATPDSRDPQVLAHRLQCMACNTFAEEQLALDRRLEAALRIPVPADLKARIIWNQSGARDGHPWRWAALAASLALAVALGFIVVGGTGQDAGAGRNLAAEIVEHVEHEPARLVFTANTTLAEPVQVSAVLESGGVRATSPVDDVVSAGLCPFHGAQVPHLVLRIDGEPVSVLLLPEIAVREAREIHEDGYHGLLVPHERGSIAIVAPRPDLVRPVRERLENAVHWRL